MMNTNAQKLSISLPVQQCEFIDEYQQAHHYKSRSEVIKQALYVLQQLQLEQDYREADAEIDDAFDTTSQDGLDDDQAW